MPLTGLFFYMFAVMLIGSALMVISVRNPVHAVLFLILAFFNSAALFLMLGAEFLAMLLVIVYVGAVAVLFLFVVMMLDVDFAELRSGFNSYLPVGALIGLVLLMELVLVLGPWEIKHATEAAVPNPLTNTEAIGQLLYTKYVYFFEVAGLVLLVAMVGAIVLTLRHKEGVKRQDIAVQVARDPKKAIEIKNVEPGTGL